MVLDTGSRYKPISRSAPARKPALRFEFWWNLKRREVNSATVVTPRVFGLVLQDRPRGLIVMRVMSSAKR